MCEMCAEQQALHVYMLIRGPKKCKLENVCRATLWWCG